MTRLQKRKSVCHVFVYSRSAPSPSQLGPHRETPKIARGAKRDIKNTPKCTCFNCILAPHSHLLGPLDQILSSKSRPSINFKISTKLQNNNKYLGINISNSNKLNKTCWVGIVTRQGHINQVSKALVSHYRLKWRLGLFLSQKMFKSKVLFLSEKGIFVQIKLLFQGCEPDFYPKNCSKYLENKIWRY